MKIKSPFLIRIAGTLICWLIKSWMNTTRFHVRFLGGPDTDCAHEEGTPFKTRIYCGWHEYLLTPVHFGGFCEMAMIISRHQDGNLLSVTAEKTGFKLIRGSTRSGAQGVLKSMLESVEHYHIAITPDGPHGPRRHFSPGAVFVASETGKPIILMGYAYTRCKRYPRSWDNFAWPRLFTKICGILSEEIYIPANLDKAQLEIWRQKMEDRLNELSDQAQQWADSGKDEPGIIRVYANHIGRKRHVPIT